MKLTLIAYMNMIFLVCLKKIKCIYNIQGYMFKTCAKELTKWRERLATRRENKKAATARACQADNMKPCAP